MTAHQKHILHELAGIVCGACGNPKEPQKTFCKKCYYKLPPRMRSALYQRFGEGYEAAYDEASAFLVHRAAAREGRKL